MVLLQKVLCSYEIINLVSCYHFSDAGSFIEIHTRKSWGQDTEHGKEDASELNSL